MSTAQTKFDSPFVATDDQILPVASVLKIYTVLQRNFLFYKQLIGVPLFGILQIGKIVQFTYPRNISA